MSLGQGVCHTVGNMSYNDRRHCLPDVNVQRSVKCPAHSSSAEPGQWSQVSNANDGDYLVSNCTHLDCQQGHSTAVSCQAACAAVEGCTNVRYDPASGECCLKRCANASELSAVKDSADVDEIWTDCAGFTSQAYPGLAED